jgi:bifunctional non-homologous end joining protein LigD
MVIWKPMLACSATELPVGPAWTYEVKWDGYRAIAVREGARVQLVSRSQKDLTRDYPTVVAALRGLKASSFVLDGEIVALGADGRPSFQALQHRRTSPLGVAYYAFDLLDLNGESLQGQTLEGRRRRLNALLAGSGSGVLLSEPLPGTPAQIEREIRRLGLEGVVAKRRDSPYRPGQRSEAWVKVKFSPRQEFVIGGFKPNASTFESILVGYYEKRKLCFAARVRAGFTPHMRAEVFSRIADLTVAKCPFVNLPNSTGASHWGEGITADDMKKFIWLKPRVVVEVAFVEWTESSLLRHAQFVGMREDKKPSHVTRHA